MVQNIETLQDSCLFNCSHLATLAQQARTEFRVVLEQQAQAEQSNQDKAYQSAIQSRRTAEEEHSKLSQAARLAEREHEHRLELERLAAPNRTPARRAEQRRRCTACVLQTTLARATTQPPERMPQAWNVVRRFGPTTRTSRAVACGATRAPSRRTNSTSRPNPANLPQRAQICPLLKQILGRASQTACSTVTIGIIVSPDTRGRRNEAIRSQLYWEVAAEVWPRPGARPVTAPLVAVVESRKLGGTCVNVGCVPKKAMFNAASLAENSAAYAGYGFKLDTPKLDWGTLKKRRDAYIERLNGIYAENLKRESVTVFEGYGKLLNSTTVEVNGVQLKAAHILIAVGGYPKVPDVPGAQLGITSNGFFALKEQPKSVAIVGTGYIGVELAGIFHALGSESNLYFKYDTVLPHFDTLLRTELLSHFAEQGLEFKPPTPIQRVNRLESGKLKITTGDGKDGPGYDCLIWATGRAPSTSSLGLEQAQVG